MKLDLVNLSLTNKIKNPISVILLNQIQIKIYSTVLKILTHNENVDSIILI